VTSFTFKSGADGSLTAFGTAEQFGKYSINILSHSIIELLVVNPETKALSVYRLIKNVPLPQQSMMGMFLQMAPLLLLLVFQKFMGDARPAARAGKAEGRLKSPLIS
jgi:hypothetical protein